MIRCLELWTGREGASIRDALAQRISAWSRHTVRLRPRYPLDRVLDRQRSRCGRCRRCVGSRSPPSPHGHGSGQNVRQFFCPPRRRSPSIASWYSDGGRRVRAGTTHPPRRRWFSETSSRASGCHRPGSIDRATWMPSSMTRVVPVAGLDHCCWRRCCPRRSGGVADHAFVRRSTWAPAKGSVASKVRLQCAKRQRQRDVVVPADLAHDAGGRTARALRRHLDPVGAEPRTASRAVASTAACRFPAASVAQMFVAIDALSRDDSERGRRVRGRGPRPGSRRNCGAAHRRDHALVVGGGNRPGLGQLACWPRARRSPPDRHVAVGVDVNFNASPGGGATLTRQTVWVRSWRRTRRPSPR